MPSCASAGHTPEECGDQLEKDMLSKMGSILDDLHEVNPKLQIVGFGYDTMFGGLGCEVLSRTIFPQCWKESNVTSPINVSTHSSSVFRVYGTSSHRLDP